MCVCARVRMRVWWWRRLLLVVRVLGLGDHLQIPDGHAEQSFTMALNGVVDAAVNGGVANYRAFVTGEFRTTNPEIAEDIDANPVSGQHTCMSARPHAGVQALTHACPVTDRLTGRPTELPSGRPPNRLLDRTCTY